MLFNCTSAILLQHIREKSLYRCHSIYHLFYRNMVILKISEWRSSHSRCNTNLCLCFLYHLYHDNLVVNMGDVDIFKKLQSVQRFYFGSDLAYVPNRSSNKRFQIFCE